jgi:S-adenosylmethionine synthetase
MPLPISLAHKLTRRLAEARRGDAQHVPAPDGKSQVTVEYANGKPRPHRHRGALDPARASVSTTRAASTSRRRSSKVIPAELLDDNTKFHINPTGRFVVGGPMGDSGLTGRKIIVDTYGGMGRHGGGAFSARTPQGRPLGGLLRALHRQEPRRVAPRTEVQRCEVQLAYAIGVAEARSAVARTGAAG